MTRVDPHAPTTAIEFDARVSECMRTLAPQFATIQADPRATLRQSGLPTRERARVGAILDVLQESASRNSAPPLRLGSRLGEGGMGVVHVGHQSSLDRLVAVKMARPHRASETETARLVHEAAVTGSLEHPNVVPIYDVRMNESGQPQIMMRRIEGSSWSELLADPDAVREGRDVTDPLEWHLRILLSVCDALELAHDRGLVHRDIKPDNVMVGRFGEVYLLDWGLAVESGHRDEAGVGAVGTPAFMAPEMMTQAEIGPRTDVYLLGATLFFVAAGRPPHGTGSLNELIVSVLRSEPDFPPDFPAGLRSICARAMHRDAAARYGDVGAFRSAVRHYLRTRGSEMIAKQALQRAEELVARIRDGAPRGALYELYGECRFGFREALRQWPQNEVARRGLERVIDSMVRQELAEGDARAAALLLTEFDEPPDALVDAVAGAQAEAERELERRAALERLGRDLDLRVGQRTRFWFAFTLGMMWTLIPILTGVRLHVRGHLMQPWELLTWPIAMAGAVLIVAAVGRDNLMRSAINRRMVGVLLTVMSAMELSHLGLLVLGTPIATIQVVDILTFVGMGAAWTAFIDRRLWPSIVSFALAFVCASYVPERRFFVLAAANFLCVLNFYWVWSPTRQGDIEPARKPEGPQGSAGPGS